MAGEGLEEEELWLYGGSPTCDEEDGSTPSHSKSPETLQNTSTESQDQKEVSQKVSKSCSDDDDEDSDTDSDDDVEVTIGDIRTGAPSCMTSAGNLNVKSYTTAAKFQPKGIDFSAPGCINGLPVIEVDLDSFEDKPWRKPGADISDYFNYGFNEATWKVYCEKQRRLQMGLDTGHLQSSHENKITVHQGRTEKGAENGCLNADLKSNMSLCRQEKISTITSPNRKIEATTDAVGGVVCNITRVEGRRWDNHDSEDIPIQVLGDHGYKPHAPIHHQQPPPPLLPPPPNIASNPHPFSGPPPPHFFQRPPLPPHQITPSLQPPALLPPPLVPPPSLHIHPMNGPHIPYNSRPPQQRHNYNSIDSRLINYQPAVSTAHSPWVTNINKGTGSFGGNDWASRRQRERDSDRPRNLATNNYRTCVNSLKTLQPLVLPCEDRYPRYHREKSYEHERKYRRSEEHPRDRSWEREEKPRGEQRQRDREESSKHKSSRHKQDSEERESHRRHKRKKSKRGKEEKSSSEDRSVATRRSHRD
ncbi:pre-mRNA 3'-end-processing factor FIP1-like [Pelobates fuscus]|uniref:pre-mRNA 3'-end-processing factor FIP1-like n=1 Tax=Pelobates fuscus TaxID=191477 RepID=UPI002FE4772A